MESWGLTETTAPTIEPVTLAEAKAHCKVDTNDDDPLLTLEIAAARQYAQLRTGRQLISAIKKLWLDRFPAEIVLPCPPLAATPAIAITYVDQNGDTQTLAAAAYQTTSGQMPARIRPAYGYLWPSTRSQMEAVQVAFTCGYGATMATVPDLLRGAILMMVEHLYENREPFITGMIIATFPLSVAHILDSHWHGWEF